MKKTKNPLTIILCTIVIEIYLTRGKTSKENNYNTSANGTNKKPVSMKNNLIVLGVLVAIIAVIIVIQLIKK